MKLEPDSPEPRSSAPAWPQSSAPEDGYEAALRAADALFSGGREPSPSISEASSDAAEASHPGGGRVLRSLDEPPSEEMLRLEAEFAPKKRGRKPGSKNKPKAPVPALTDDYVAGRPVGNASSESAISPPAFDASEGQGVPAVPAIATRPAVTAARAAIQVPGLSVGAGAPRGERYAWVRTRLKPGEQWKRRLPKVAW